MHAGVLHGGCVAQGACLCMHALTHSHTHRLHVQGCPEDVLTSTTILHGYKDSAEDVGVSESNELASAAQLLFSQAQQQQQQGAAASQVHAGSTAAAAGSPLEGQQGVAVSMSRLREVR